jgi:hypothetical protein
VVNVQFFQHYQVPEAYFTISDHPTALQLSHSSRLVAGNLQHRILLLTSHILIQSFCEVIHGLVIQVVVGGDCDQAEDLGVAVAVARCGSFANPALRSRRETPGEGRLRLGCDWSGSPGSVNFTCAELMGSCVPWRWIVMELLLWGDEVRMSRGCL